MLLLYFIDHLNLGLQIISSKNVGVIASLFSEEISHVHGFLMFSDLLILDTVCVAYFFLSERFQDCLFISSVTKFHVNSPWQDPFIHCPGYSIDPFNLGTRLLVQRFLELLQRISSPSISVFFLFGASIIQLLDLLD